MSFLTITSCLLVFVYDCSAVDIMPELKKNILNFGYGVNFKYEQMLSHSFDRFYIVTKFKLPKTKDLKLDTFDLTLNAVMLTIHLLPTLTMQNSMNYCMKITPYA